MRKRVSAFINYVCAKCLLFAGSLTFADKLCLMHTSMSSNAQHAACRARRPVIDRVAAELLDGGPMETVEGTRIVELLLAMPPVESQTPIDSLREVPLLFRPFACRLTSSSVTWRWHIHVCPA